MPRNTDGPDSLVALITFTLAGCKSLLVTFMECPPEEIDDTAMTVAKVGRARSAGTALSELGDREGSSIVRELEV